MSSPTPRPALRRATDAHVSPASPVAADEGKHPHDDRSSGGKGAKKGKKSKTELRVRLPKKLRVQFDERVKEEGY